MKEEKGTLFHKFLNWVEVVGNKLPHPVMLFVYLSIGVVILSALLSASGLTVTGMLISGGELQESTIGVNSLLTGDGIAWMFTSAVSNFTEYAPLGTVLVAMLGVGIAEQSGLINTMLKKIVQATPKSMICPVVIFAGVMSNVASDAGFVVLIPLGAMVFYAYGRHPIAGIAAAFCGVSGGFSANLVIGTLDPLLQGITQEAVSILDPNYEVQVLGNYYFMFLSTFLITIVGTLVTQMIVEPRLGSYEKKSSSDEGENNMGEILGEEQKGLRYAGFAALAYFLFIVICCIPQDSFFRNVNGGFLSSPASPLISSVIILITLGFFIPGATYGLTTKSFNGINGVCDALTKSMSSMSGYIVLSFVAAQFIAYFNKTNLGTVLAVSGADFFSSTNIGLIPLMVLFVLFSGFINLFMGSASAKWNILAPVFVPMFMMLGYSPELAQLAYRIGDSCTNLITPLMSYYAMILMLAQKYKKDLGLGTLVTIMLPYTLVLFVSWTLMMIVWLALGMPIGPGAELLYTMGG